MIPIITTLAKVPGFARGQVRDLRVRWALEEVEQAYGVVRIASARDDAHRGRQPFGQVPCYRDDEVEIFESGAIVLRIAERGGGGLLPSAPGERMRAIQWLFAALNTVEPAVTALAVNDIFERGRPWSAARRPTVVAALERRLDELAAALGELDWLDGAFTVGDLMMVSVLRQLNGTGLLDGLPTLAAYVARGEARPAHVRALGHHLADLDRGID